MNFWKLFLLTFQKFLKCAVDCNLESSANSSAKALGIDKSSKAVDEGNVSKILDAAKDCNELTNCKIQSSIQMYFTTDNKNSMS